MLVRSYSRNSGSILLEMEMNGEPGILCKADSTASSWAGLRKENRKDTAIESTSACCNRSTRACIASGTRSSIIVPLWSTLSGRPKRNSQGARAGGLSKSRLYNSDRTCRPISSTSSNPSVVTRAVRPPFPSSRALVATVDPCTKSAEETPTSATPWMMPNDGSLGVDGSLCTCRRPSSMTAMSVKVPPTSIPTIVLVIDSVNPQCVINSHAKFFQLYCVALVSRVVEADQDDLFD